MVNDANTWRYHSHNITEKNLEKSQPRNGRRKIPQMPSCIVLARRAVTATTAGKEWSTMPPATNFDRTIHVTFIRILLSLLQALGHWLQIPTIERKKERKRLFRKLWGKQTRPAYRLLWSKPVFQSIFAVRKELNTKNQAAWLVASRRPCLFCVEEEKLWIWPGKWDVVCNWSFLESMEQSVEPGSSMGSTYLCLHRRHIHMALTPVKSTCSFPWSAARWQTCSSDNGYVSALSDQASGDTSMMTMGTSQHSHPWWTQ